MLSLDIQKAFDSLETSYLISVLWHIGCGSNLLRTVTVLYEAPLAWIKINDSLTDPISIKWKTCQGCPLFLTSLALVGEPLGNAIRNAKPIKGLEIRSFTCKINLFTDDMLLYLTDQIPSLVFLKKAAGLPVPPDWKPIKTSQLSSLNTLQDQRKLPLIEPTTITGLSLKYLGIHITNLYLRASETKSWCCYARYEAETRFLE